MNKTKQMSVILIISVFIALCYGLITTFLIPHAESNLVNLNSYYSDENGEKLKKEKQIQLCQILNEIINTKWSATDELKKGFELVDLIKKFKD